MDVFDSFDAAKRSLQYFCHGTGHICTLKVHGNGLLRHLAINGT